MRSVRARFHGAILERKRREKEKEKEKERERKIERENEGLSTVDSKWLELRVLPLKRTQQGHGRVGEEDDQKNELKQPKGSLSSCQPMF